MPILPNSRPTLPDVLGFLFGLSCLCWLKVPGTPLTAAELALTPLLALAGWRLVRRRLSVGISVPGAVPLLAALLLSVVSAGQSASLGGALKGALQPSLYLLLAPLALSRLPEMRRSLNAGLATGLVANLLLALAQTLLNGGGPATGLLLSRTGYGIGMALATAILLRQDALPLQATTAPWGNAAAILQGLTLTTPSGLLTGLVALVTGWRSPFVIAARRLRPAVLLVAALLPLLCLPARRDALLDALQWRDEQGQLRRFVQERLCASRALRDAWMLGHGPGSYQRTVGLAVYRGSLPRPSENKVELNSQNGYQVFGVEHGALAAALLGLSLLLALRRRLVQRLSLALPLTLLLGLAFTPLLAGGSGLLVATALAALDEDERRTAPDAWRLPLRPVLLLWLAAIATALLCAQRNAKLAPAPPPAEFQLAAHDGLSLILEAEEALAAPPFELEQTPDASQGRALAIRDRILEQDPTLRQARATLAFETTVPATVTCWLRVRWQDGCGNSLFLAWDDGQPFLAGNDGTYQTWHWIRLPQTQTLAPGPHRLHLLPSEDGIAIDQLLITDQHDAIPVGRLDANATHQNASDVEPARPATPLPEPQPRQRPFTFAVSGPYRGGFEAALTEMGLPFTLLYDSELETYEHLKDYPVILLSNPMNLRFRRLNAAMTQFVSAGGTLVVDRAGHWAQRLFQRQTLFPGHQELCYGGQVSVPDLPGLCEAADFAVPADVLCEVYLSPQPPDSPWKGHGTYILPDGRRTVALWERTFPSGGRILLLTAPLSFQTMWRDRKAEPLLRSLLAHIAARHDVRPLLRPDSLPRPQEDWTPLFDDDFMRTGDTPGAPWQTLSGAFACTGDTPSVPDDAFALRCLQPGTLRLGEPTWRAYRPACSVRGAGQVTLSLTTGTGNTVSATLDTIRRTVSLSLARPHGWTRPEPLPLAMRLPAEEATTTWQRLSLMWRDRQWQLHLNGERLLTLTPTFTVTDADRLGPSGSCRLAVSAPGILLDDVAVRPVHAIPDGTDRAPGEEGSCLALGRSQDQGLERSTVFSPARLWRAAPDLQNTLVSWLEAPADATFAVLGQRHSPSPRPDSQHGTLLALPADTTPPTDVPFPVVPHWRDYVFKDRLTDWRWTGSPWTRLLRWSCDTRWSWLGTETSHDSILWHRLPFAGNLDFRAFLAVSMNSAAHDNEYHRGRDLNLVLGGNGQNLKGAWTVRIMRTAPDAAKPGQTDRAFRGCELWHDGKLLASAPLAGLGVGHTLHHNWYEVGVSYRRRILTIWFENRLALSFPLPQDAPDLSGFLGIWTHDNAIQVARAQIAARPQ